MQAVLRARLQRFHAGDWLALLEDGRARQPPQLAQEPAGSEPEGWAQARAMILHARLGHLSKAAASLVSLGVAPWSPEVEEELRRKVAPPGAPPAS